MGEEENYLLQFD